MSGAEPTGYYGPYRGLCVSNTDPAGLGRITAIVPQIFGNTSTVTDWALPMAPAGTTRLPTPGQGVWLMFEGGDLNYPVYTGQWQANGGLYASLTGTGETETPGALTQEGDYEVVGALTVNPGEGAGGLNLNVNGGGILINEDGDGGTSIVDSGGGISITETGTGGIDITTSTSDISLDPGGNGVVLGSLIGNPAGWMVTAAAQSIANTTATLLTSTSYDGNAARTFLYGGMAYSNGQLKVPVTGLYAYIVSNYWNNNNTSEYQSFIMQNSSQYTHGEALLGNFDPNAGTTISAQGLIHCAASDLLGGGVYQNTGGPVTVNGTTPGGHIFVWLVSQ